ncbi:MAG: DUF1735 domain-containing protein [Bacteroidales bacterium]|nr:DUF1735 domain-containing protein [Bacteroidales bacterium]
MKRIASLCLISVAFLLAFACTKEGGDESSATTAVLGVSIKDLPAVVEVPESQSQAFEVVVVANPGPSDVIQVTLGTDETLVEKYNAANGTAYEMLPASAYELPSSALMVMKYNKTSAPGTVRLKGAGCELDKVYVLPVVVSSVKGTAPYEAPEDRVAYVVFKMLEAQMAGAGTQTDPYIMTQTDEFDKLGNLLKTGETVYVRLGADIDYNGAAWSQADATGAPVVFDGDNHSIRNVKAEHGLFFNLEGTVKNLVIEGVNIEMGAEQGGILAHTAGANDGDLVTIQNVTVRSSSITNTGYVGALIGRITRGTVDNVKIDCTVYGAARVAGAFGHAISSTITNTTVAGTVTGTDYYVGGLVGLMYGCDLKNCSASANVTCESLANSYSRIGGLVGQMTAGGTIEKCWATGSVTGMGYFGGGLVGVAEAAETVEGTVTVKPITIKQSYATGDVALIREGNKKDAGAGGLVGRFESGDLIVTDCYATGAVEADRYSAGFIGDVNVGNLTITNGFTNGDFSKLGPDANGNHSDGIAVGCLRTPESVTIKCTGFVAWCDLDYKKFIYQDLVASAGNYLGAEGTVSQQAAAFGWDTAIWDLSGDVPTLK